jgi:hypothetical protein
VSAPTPGQAAYEAFRSAVPDWVCNVPAGPWDELSPAVQAGFDAIAAQEPQPAPGAALDVAVEALRVIALGVELNAIGKGHPIDPSVTADKALVAIRDLRAAEPVPAQAEALGDWPAILADVTQQRDDLRERAEAAEAAKRQAKGELAALENRLSLVIAAAVVAEQARAEAAETEAARLRDLLAEQERAAGMDAEYMAPRDAARVLKVDPTTLVTFESAGKLTTVRTPWGHRRYRTADVKALRREREARRG